MRKNDFILLSLEEKQMIPLDRIDGFDVRPGFYEINGATALANGVNFTIHSQNAVSCELLLYKRGAPKPYAVLPFPDRYRIGKVYSMIVFGLKITEFEYAYRVDGPYAPEKGLLFDKSKPLLDPYARAVTGQSEWGSNPNKINGYRARVVVDDFDWGSSAQPRHHMRDLIIYETHVRGFTKHPSSKVKYPGTFQGLKEKIPYLKAMGITAVELMPVFEFDETMGKREVGGKTLLDYWGYNTVGFFAPNTSYAAGTEYNREGDELKSLVKELHENGIEVILDVVFNHTAEGNEQGPFFSFKGFDNNIYYMLTPDGKYYNFSGCGNTINGNHPVVQQMILECLRYWIVNYRVDGFRFDLASILGRNEDGSPMNQPPLLRNLAADPILGDAKLIAEAWDAGGLYQVGSFPAWNRWAEWNGKYRDDLRSFLKGDYWLAPAAAKRICGSPDLYTGQYRGYNSSVNFLTCHDGFSLYDLYSYNEKHNWDNGWDNTDGSNDNRSWNCGAEGETEDDEVLRLRMRLIKNACTVLMCSRGTPMFLAGDEFGDTRFGNNNPYCQDNEISWLDWTRLEKNKDIYEFFRYMIQFRKDHPAIRGDMLPSAVGFPFISVHTEQPWQGEITEGSQYLGVMFAGHDPDRDIDDIVYLALNVHWEEREITLPFLPEGYRWQLYVNTYWEQSFDCTYCEKREPVYVSGTCWMKARTAAVFVVQYSSI
ncbi:MAG: alpha-amylase family glycosyl hydrolase [Eubacteriales bacterium]|nr:alpha-amylase family glycosyl hydrolase [Eubacteriales bacterium]